MMQAFRNSAKPLIYIVAISFFAWLVLDLSGLTGGTGLFTSTSVGKINGQSVDTRVFQDAVSRLTEQQQRQSSEPLGIAETEQIRDQVWDQFIQDRVLAEELERRGITVSAAELAEAIRNAPPQDFYALPEFQTDGQFDPTKYQRWLASAVGQQYVPSLEQEYRRQFLQAKLARTLVAPLYVSDADLWERYRDQSETVEIGAVEVTPDAISDVATAVTPSEIEEYYRVHQAELHRPATAWLSFIMMDRRPIASDTAAALGRAQALRQEIVGGTPFEEVARRESADTVSGSRGGDLGAWTKGSFDPEFESAASRLRPKVVSEPVLTRFGYHLLEITSRSGDTTRGRHLLVPIELAGAHMDQVDARADSLEALAADRLDPAALDTAARALGLEVQSTGPVVREGPATAPADAMVWAFQAKVGEHSPVILSPAAYFVFRLDSLQLEGVPPLAGARGEIEARLRVQKKLVEARRLAAEALSQVTAGKSLAQAAKDLGLRYDVLGPFSRVTAPAIGSTAIGAAMNLAVGRRMGPVEGPASFYLFEGLARTAADSVAFIKELPRLRDQTLQNLGQLYLRQYLASLRQRARIVDRRSQLYLTQAQAEAAAPPTPGQPR